MKRIHREHGMFWSVSKETETANGGVDLIIAPHILKHNK